MAKTGKKQKNGKRRGRLLRVLGGLLLLLVLVTAGAGTVAGRSEKAFPGVTVDGIAVGGRTEEEIRTLLDTAGYTERSRRVLHISVCDRTEAETDPIRAGLYPEPDAAAAAAVGWGRGELPWVSLWNYCTGLVQKPDLRRIACEADREYLLALAQGCAGDFLQAMGSGYELDIPAGQLRLVKGQGTVTVDAGALAEAILAALEQGAERLDYRELCGSPAAPDFEALAEALTVEAVDAAFSTDGSHSILPETVGCRFDPETARALWAAAQPAETVVIPLEVTEPAVTAAELEALLYRDLLGATTTKYNNSGPNRCSNVRLAAASIDGVVLFPGEEFSFNTVVGRRTEEAGYLPAPAYGGLENVREEIGGGVCQVATTLYASTLFSFLQVTSHTCHIYPPNYIQMGMDTTVTIPASGGRSIDYRFLNSKNYPIRITAVCEETEKDGLPYKTITVEIWGTLEEEDFMPVEFDNSVPGLYDYDRVIEPAYADREGYVIKFTHDESSFEDDTGSGIRTLTHRKVYDSAGRLVQDRIINSTYSAGYAMDTYYYHTDSGE